LHLQIARLVLALAALGDVAQERFDPERVGPGERFGPRRDLDPDRGFVSPPQAQEARLHGAAAPELGKILVASSSTKRSGSNGRTSPLGVVGGHPKMARRC
jgi:hypothetical protein